MVGQSARTESPPESAMTYGELLANYRYFIQYRRRGHKYWIDSSVQCRRDWADREVASLRRSRPDLEFQVEER